MKKLLNFPLFFSIIMISVLIGCGDDVEPMSGINPIMTVSPGDKIQEAVVGTLKIFKVELTGERATFSSLSVTQSFDDKIKVYALIDNETEELIGTPYSADFTFTPTSEMKGKIVTLLFRYENKTKTNSGATVINLGSETIELTVREQ